MKKNSDSISFMPHWHTHTHTRNRGHLVFHPVFFSLLGMWKNEKEKISIEQHEKQKKKKKIKLYSIYTQRCSDPIFFFHIFIYKIHTLQYNI